MDKDKPEGKCRECYKLTENKSRCDLCLEKNKISSKKRLLRLKNNNLCARCTIFKDNNKNHCDKCTDKIKVYTAIRTQRKKDSKTCMKCKNPDIVTNINRTYNLYESCFIKSTSTTNKICLDNPNLLKDIFIKQNGICPYSGR